MTSLFLSHSSRDRVMTDKVSGLLRDAGYAALFVDAAHENGIPAGHRWERELYSQVRRCAGVVFLASAASVESRWCFAEISLARSLGRPVFPVRIEEGVVLPLLDDVQWVDATDVDEGLPRLRAGLAAAGIDAEASTGWDRSRPPYPGLVSFQREDAAMFFGRDGEVAHLLELLQPTVLRSRGRFVAIVGPSGSGKSSLLRGGLLPRLDRTPEKWLVLPPLVPGRQPVRALARSLVAAFAAHGEIRSVDEMTAAVTDDGLLVPAGELAELAETGAREPAVVVVIDQAEELVTVAGPAEQAAFLDLVTTALTADRPIWVVATLRSEYLSSDPERAGLAAAIDDAVLVEPLARARLAEVIRRPAGNAGFDFDPGLVERMVEDTAGGDALPLLAYTLHELAASAGPDGTITSGAYEMLGGVVGALRGRADRLLSDLERRGQGDRVLPTLMQLATVTGPEEPVRRRVALTALTADERTVVDAFTDASLLVKDQRPGPDGVATVEVAHEALLRQWQPLRTAIETHRSALQLRAEIERLAADWIRSGGDESYLLRGERLSSFLLWATQHEARLGPDDNRFLDASQELSDRVLTAARRSNRRLRLLVAGLASLLVLVLVAGSLAVVQSRRAEAQAALANAQQLESQAESLLPARPDTALLAALEGWSLSRGQGQPPPRALVSALARLTHRSRTIATGQGPTLAFAYRSDGSLLASASNDGTIRLWDAATGALHGEPLAPGIGSIRSVVFSPNGRVLAATGDNGATRFWDVASGQILGPPVQLLGNPGTIAFSPDATLLASAGADGVVRIWKLSGQADREVTLPGHQGAVSDVAFSPDGRLLASAGADHTIRLWDVATSSPHGAPLLGHADKVSAVAFSPDGRLLASASVDRTAELWDVASGKPHGPLLTGHTGPVDDVAFSPDGTELASASDDFTIRLWDVATGLPRGGPLLGHSQAVVAVAFDQHGISLASASLDQTLHIWDVAETPTISRALLGHNGVVYGVSWSRDGRLVATAGEDQMVRLWETATGLPRGPALGGNRDAVNEVAFSPDGILLASGGVDGSVRLWDVATGAARGGPLVDPDNAVLTVAFNPDSTLVAAGENDGARLWDIRTGQQRRPSLDGTGSVDSVAFSPDGRLLAAAGAAQFVYLWDVAAGSRVGPPLAGHSGPINGVAFSPDGTLLATASSDQTVRLWALPGGEPVAVLAGHAGVLYNVAFSPDGATIAAAAEDGTVRMWDTATREPNGLVLTGHTGAVSQIAFNPDGTRLASSSTDQTARLWNFGFSDWVNAACGLVQRNLSLGEWNQLVPALAYNRTCPGYPSGEGAPPDAPAARYD